MCRSGPRGRRGIRNQQHQVGLGLALVQEPFHPKLRRGATIRLCGAVESDATVHVRGRQHPDRPGLALEFRGQRRGQPDHVGLRGDGNEDDAGPARAGAGEGVAGVLLSGDEPAGHGQHRAGLGEHELLETASWHACEVGRSRGDDGGVPGDVGQQRSLPDELPRADLGHRLGEVPVAVALQHADPAGDHQVGGVGGVALGEEHRARLEVDHLGVVHDRGEVGGLRIGEQLREMPLEPRREQARRSQPGQRRPERRLLLQQRDEAGSIDLRHLGRLERAQRR